MRISLEEIQLHLRRGELCESSRCANVHRATFHNATFVIKVTNEQPAGSTNFPLPYSSYATEESDCVKVLLRG